MIEFIEKKLFSKISNTSICIYRIFFGILLQVLILRFFYYNWIEKYFLEPNFFFKYYPFEFIPELPNDKIIFLFYGMYIFSFLITIGLFYRTSILLFTICFGYYFLYDISYYLNHHYLILLLCFLLCFIEADERFSIKSFYSKKSKSDIEAWKIYILLFQISIVYFFGFVAKLKFDWLIEAMPLKIWLYRNSDIPILGYFFSMNITAYLFSYFALFFDMLIPFILLSKKFNKIGFILAFIFHISTFYLFQIGMFPWIMLLSIFLFIAPNEFEILLKRIKFFTLYKNSKSIEIKSRFKKLILVFLTLYISFQILFPFRYLLYPNNLSWSEEGFRFSWNIMIIEKKGFVEFTVIDSKTKEIFLIDIKKYLTSYQIFMMSTQPDMILQFSKFLKNEFAKQNKEVEIYVDSFVSLNGNESKRFIDEKIDLGNEKESFHPKKWINSLELR